jgi:TRAP-type mannitol/chloroaromatic compound transport system permease small subunit
VSVAANLDLAEAARPPLAPAGARSGAGALLGLAERLDRFVSRAGMAGGWMIALLVAVVCVDVVTRKFVAFHSTFLQELEWHIHTIVFTLSFGFAYVRGAHVRIDVIRDRLSRPARARLELVGIILLLVPFAVLILWVGVTFAHQALVQNEGSTSAQGIPHRWIIKSLIPIGMVLLLTAAVATALRAWCYLRGEGEVPEAFEKEAVTLETQEAA